MYEIESLGNFLNCVIFCSSIYIFIEYLLIKLHIITNLFKIEN